MMMKLFALLILVLSFNLLACEIEVPQNLVILGENANLVESIRSKNCSENALLEVSDALKSVEGKMTSFQLQEILSARINGIRVHTPLVQVQNIRNLIRDQIHLPPGVQLFSSEAVNAQNYLSLAPLDKVEVECIGCLFGSNQVLNLNVIGFDGSHRTLSVKADFKRLVRAYRLTSFLPAFSEIEASSLKEELVEAIPHTDLVTNLETLKFFKVNKPLKAGELLRLSDLNAQNLVKAGLKTEVIIENELVKLRTHGISRSNGTLGQFVEVFHPQKNKKYQGKVIDINKVLVEL
jgi:hypothetical protein